VFFRPNNERIGFEVLIETLIRKQLRLKAHTVSKVVEQEDALIIYIDRLGHRLLRCGVCRHRCRAVHSVRPEREWHDLSIRTLPLKLRYRPRRVACPRCGVRVEDFPWAEPLFQNSCPGEGFETLISRQVLQQLLWRFSSPPGSFVYGLENGRF
jgi:hypothetical protein